MAQIDDVGHVRRRAWLAIAVQLFFPFGISVRASGQTAPSREYIRLGANVIAIENPAQQCVATPTFSPGSGSYNTSETVTISSTTSGATIRYTLDGTTPTETYGTIGTSVTISSPVTLKAIAYETGMCDSPVASATYTIQTATPTFSPGPGTYNSAVTVTLSSATPGATIRYTLDGTTPTEAHGFVGPTANVNGSTTLKAMAYSSGIPDSQIAAGTYAIQVATPTFSPGGGTYTSVQTVTISCATSGATIRYTTDGTTPSATNGTLGTSVTISSNTTLKAIAYNGSISDSAIASATYTINLPAVATPSFNPGGGTYTSRQTVTISDATSGATIMYTTNGSTPSHTNGTAGRSVAISCSLTLQALGYKTGMNDSATGSANYSLTETISQPSAPSGPTAVAIGAAGTYATGGSVSNLGNAVQYLFNWGDGANSGWLPVGTTRASHAWSSTANYSVTVQARSASCSGSSVPSSGLTVSIGPPSASLALSGRYNIGGSWTFWITSNMPNQPFNFCGMLNGVNRGCYTPYGTTDGNGNFVSSGTFTPDSIGDWLEWAYFTGFSYQTNTIEYYVSPPSMSVSISATSWAVGGSWTLYLSSNVFNQTFDFCGSHNGGSPGCIANYVTTDGNGNWSATGTFDSSTPGSWVEWASFVGYSSNQISYSVSP